MNTNKAQDQNELFDVVDECDKVVSQATRGEVHRRGLRHRAVHIVVFNEKSEILLQKRSMGKDVAPGKWTSSCSGHLDAGESYDKAAVRELGEELGIIIEGVDALEFLFKKDACEVTGNEFVKVYKLIYDGDICHDPDEIDECRWLTFSEIKAWLEYESDEIDGPFRFIFTRLFSL